MSTGTGGRPSAGCFFVFHWCIIESEVNMSVEVRAVESKKDFKTLILNDKDICRHLDRKKIEELFDVRSHLKYINAIFERVFTDT